MKQDFFQRYSISIITVIAGAFFLLGVGITTTTLNEIEKLSNRGSEIVPARTLGRSTSADETNTTTTTSESSTNTSAEEEALQ